MVKTIIYLEGQGQSELPEKDSLTSQENQEDAKEKKVQSDLCQEAPSWL